MPEARNQVALRIHLRVRAETLKQSYFCFDFLCQDLNNNERNAAALLLCLFQLAALLTFGLPGIELTVVRPGSVRDND